MDIEIGKLVKKINNLLKRNAPHFPGAHKHRMRGWILDYLNQHDGENIYQKNIEAELLIRRSSATEIINLMERDGLIVREHVAGDKRLKRLILTEEARKCLDAFRSKVEHMESVMSAGIDEQELDIFNKVSRQVINNLEQYFCNKEGCSLC